MHGHGTKEGLNHQSLARALACSWCVSLLTGCSGAELLIKTPAEAACTDAGLRGCPEIAKGIVSFLDGNQQKGKELLAEGAAQNSPDELRQLADGILLLSQIPGASQYAGPIVDVAQVLRTRADSMPPESASAAKGKSSKHQDDGRRARSESEREERVAGGAKSTEELVRRAGHVLVLGARQAFDCADGDERGVCARLAAGPLVVTDVSFAPECRGAAALVALVQGNDARRSQQSWSIYGATAGGAWPVDEDELLIARVATRDGEDRNRCTVSWAGHATPSPTAE